MHALTHVRARKGGRVLASPRGVTDNVIREKGKAKDTYPPRRGICYMPYGQRGTRYYSRKAVREELRLFFSASEFKVRVGPGSFHSFV